MIDWNNGIWHIGYVVGIPFLTLVTLAIVALAIICIVGYFREGGEDYGGGAIIFTIFGVGLLVFLFVLLVPFDNTFHKYYPVTGKVEKIDSRLMAAGKATQERFVVVLDGKPFAIDDTRASLLKVGDDVRLMCSRDYQYAGVSGWVCEWGQEPGV